MRILGWEALLSSANGEPPYTLLQSSGDLSKFSKAEAATVTRRQIEQATDAPDYRSEQPNTALYFIITVDAA